MELECMLHCPGCGTQVPCYRKPAQNEGVYLNVCVVKGGVCPNCGGQMVRE